MKRFFDFKFEICLLLIAILTPLAHGRNVDLSTVPKRNTVQLTIYNSEDLTLVRETRAVTFKKGANPLQFSWANTLIDPSSVQLRFLTKADQLDLLDTTFPHDKPAMLYWNVKSDFDGEATIEITYFTSGITWSADYQVMANAAETALKVEGFVRVYNNSGEEYENAQVRLVVGTINLVEKIARLAQMPMEEVTKLNEKDLRKYKADALKDAADKEGWAEGADRDGGGGGAGRKREKQIIKEGLSEYFIYSIEGTETILNGWSKRMRSLEAAEVPFKIEYRYREREYGQQLVRMYLLTNDEPSKLGTTPLPDGIVRIFRDNGRGGLSFLAQQPVKYIPIGDKFEINLGPDPSVILELVKLRSWRDNIWMQIGGADMFRQVGGGVRIEVNSSVAGWDEHAQYVERIRNYTAKTIEVEIRRSWDGHVAFRSGLVPKATLFDYQTTQVRTAIEPAKKVELPFEIRRSFGRNEKQANVTLEQA
ncbi:MAG: hypothetical protein K8T91_26280, partial [Planctomycetes bacterium]|nr:hypothetical protein [Planctomycetota bacterium]